MAYSKETSIDQVLGVLTCLRDSQLEEGICIDNILIQGGLNRRIALIAEGKGARKLAGCTTVSQIVLERNPERVDIPNGATALTILGARRIELFFMPGEKIETGEEVPSLVETVLANIVFLGKGHIYKRERVLTNHQVDGWSNN